MKYQVSKSQTYNIRQETVQQPKLKQSFKKHHRETTKREKRRGKRKRKRKKNSPGNNKKKKKEEENEEENGKNLTGKSCHQGGASSVARCTDWWHKHPVGALLYRAVEPARKKIFDKCKILSIEYNV